MTAGATTATATATAAPRSLGWHGVRLLGSMKLAVWLLLILAALTWLGTLAQLGKSIHDVQREYFESWFVVAELPLSFWGKTLIVREDGSAWPLRIPLPGARMLLAARADGGTITFCKLVGTAADVATQVDAFRAFCGSVRRAP